MAEIRNFIRPQYLRAFDLIFKFSRVSRAAQHNNAIANEIDRGIQLANTLFSLENYIYLLDHLSFKFTRTYFLARYNN